MIRGHERCESKHFSGSDKAKLINFGDSSSGIFSFGQSLTVHSSQKDSLSFLEIDLAHRQGKDQKMIKMPNSK